MSWKRGCRFRGTTPDLRRPSRRRVGKLCRTHVSRYTSGSVSFRCSGQDRKTGPAPPASFGARADRPSAHRSTDRADVARRTPKLARTGARESTCRHLQIPSPRRYRTARSRKPRGSPASKDSHPDREALIRCGGASARASGWLVWRRSQRVQRRNGRETAARRVLEKRPSRKGHVRRERLSGHDRVDERGGLAHLAIGCRGERRRLCAARLRRRRRDVLGHRLDERQAHHRHDRGDRGPGPDEGAAHPEKSRLQARSQIGRRSRGAFSTPKRAEPHDQAVAPL